MSVSGGGTGSLVAGSTHLEQATDEYERDVDTVERPQATSRGSFDSTTKSASFPG